MEGICFLMQERERKASGSNILEWLRRVGVPWRDAFGRGTGNFPMLQGGGAGAGCGELWNWANKEVSSNCFFLIQEVGSKAVSEE